MELCCINDTYAIILPVATISKKCWPPHVHYLTEAKTQLSAMTSGVLSFRDNTRYI